MSNFFFLLGAAKAGTTSLYQLCSKHPGICMSEPKEPTFFEEDRQYEQGLDYYLDEYFSHGGGQPLRGDARQRNLYLPWVPERIHETFPEAKLVVSLREPARRAYSHFCHNRKHGREDQSFEQAFGKDLERIELGKRMTTPEEREQYQQTIKDNRGLYRTYVDSGYYIDQLQRYEQRFGREAIHIIIFEEMIDQPETEWERLTQFLGAETIGMPELPHENQGLVPRFEQGYRILYQLGGSTLRNWIPGPVKRFFKSLTAKRARYDNLPETTRRDVEDHFRPYNQRLYEWLGESISKWEGIRQ